MDLPDTLADETLKPDRPSKISRLRIVRPVLWMAAGSVLTILVLAIVAATFLASGSAIQEQAAMKSLGHALESYFKEYGHFPISNPDTLIEAVSIPAEGEMVTAIIGGDSPLNPRKIQFYAPPQAKTGKAGLDQSNAATIRTVDSNGTTFFLIMDLDGDGMTPNPDPRDQRQKLIRARVLVYSAGPDQNPTTWADNLVSW
ncbi:hypothetical protein [Verrucomicrobium sp. BvORR106]|uniref:hypothetical protein n=1 Tax=Verrucomicrobium sp. BvORR106 TaxID=1403819 RepID=UPI00057187CC|nr:hypothetical protein [Verrucomicrobium sp. BvORR106]